MAAPSSSSVPIQTGEIDFDAPGANGVPCRTWYKIVGKLDPNSTPVIVLHGGPGGGHEYLEPVGDLVTGGSSSSTSAVIFYDQIGCGQSTHFRDRMGDDSFWTFDLFIRELDNLVDHFRLRDTPGGFSVLGQSWGGMLGGAYASTQPRGLRKLILVSAPGSIPLYMECCKERLAGLPQETRDILEECDRRGDHESDVFQQASGVFIKKHTCQIDPMPEQVQKAFFHLKDDPTSYLTMQGPSEFVITGTAFKGWEGFKDAHKIEVPTLLLNGKEDEVMDKSFAPWFWNIRQVKWVTFQNSSHMCHWEERAAFVELCASFLSG